jgi:hypothetical protein
MNKRPKIFGAGDACEYLNISNQRLHQLLKQYNIPHQQTSSGKIFFEEDIIAFKESRKDKMKYKGKR